MANQQLLDYVKEQIKEGIGEGEIKKTLIQNGWNDADIDEALEVIDHAGEKAVPPPIPPSKAVASAGGKDLKRSANWYIAAHHYLTAGLIIPFVITAVIGFPLTILSAGNVFLTLPIGFILGVGSIWLGVMYSARYLRKHYIIEDSSNIVNLATSYMVVFPGGIEIYKVISSQFGMDQIIDFGIAIFAIVVFYLLSKKYITNTQR